MLPLIRYDRENEYVFPLGFWLRHVRTRDQEDPAELQKAVLTFYENLLMVLTYLATSDCADRRLADEDTVRIVNERLFRKPLSDGDLAAVLRRMVALFKDRGLSFSFGLSPSTLLEPVESEACDRFFELMQRGLQYGGDRPSCLLGLLDLVIFYRNRLSHGDAPVDPYIVKRANSALVEAIEPTLMPLQDAIRGLGLFWIQKTRVIEENHYRHQCGIAMGSGGNQETELETDVFLPMDRVHLVRFADDDHRNEPRILFELSPFFLVRGCDGCMRERQPFRLDGVPRGRPDSALYVGLPTCPHRIEDKVGGAAIQRFLKRLDSSLPLDCDVDEEAARRTLTLAYQAKSAHTSRIDETISALVSRVPAVPDPEPALLAAGASLRFHGPTDLQISWIPMDADAVSSWLDRPTGNDGDTSRLLRGLLILGETLARDAPTLFDTIHPALDDRVVELLDGLTFLRNPLPCLEDPSLLRNFLEVSGTIGDFILGESFESGIRVNTRIIRLWDGFDAHQEAKNRIKQAVLQRFLNQSERHQRTLDNRLVDLMALIWFGADLDSRANKNAMSHEFNLLMRQDPCLGLPVRPGCATSDLQDRLDHLALVVEVISNHFFYVRKEFGSGALDAMQRVLPVIDEIISTKAPLPLRPLNDLLIALSFYYLFTQRYS
jgi:hypothetical protein